MIAGKAWTKRADTPKRLSGRRLQERRAWWFRQHPLCVLCFEKGRAVIARELDHIVPISEGGAEHDPNNWRSLCHDCNQEQNILHRGGKPRPRIGIDGFPIKDDR